MSDTDAAQDASLGTITLLCALDAENKGARSVWQDTQALVQKTAAISSEQLKKSLKTFCDSFLDATNDLTSSDLRYELKTIELSIDVTAKGEIRLISSASIETKGAIKLVFERN